MSVLSCEWVGNAPTMKGRQMEQREVILGVDTHLDTHVGAVINDIGQLLGTKSVSTDYRRISGSTDVG